MKTPPTVLPEEEKLYTTCDALRVAIKETARQANELRTAARAAMNSEVGANATLAYRHLEDASMRFGKAMQALDGGVSVYDKPSTVGAPDDAPRATDRIEAQA